MSTIAFLGLGRMGGPMAANLVKAGHTVNGYDPQQAAVDRAADSGVAVKDSLIAAVTDAETVITMLPSGKHLLGCYRDILPSLRPGTLLWDSSTVSVADARAAAEMARNAGHEPVDAPVSGGVPGAQAGTLTFMVGADDAGYARAKPLLDIMAAKHIHCGASGAGQAAKICNNMVLGVSMIAVSEAFALGRSLGLSDQALYDVASTSSGQCWSLTTYCPVPGPVPTSPANNDYGAGFTTGLMSKDLHLAQAAAEDNDVSTALGAHAMELYDRFAKMDGPHRDFSAIITAVIDGAFAEKESE